MAPVGRLWTRTLLRAAFVLGATVGPALAEERVVRPAEPGLQGDAFGNAMAVSGETLLVGAPGVGDTIIEPGGVQGQRALAYVYVKRGGVFQQEARLTPQVGGPGSRFGRSVALEGDTAVVGAPFEPGGGAAYVFRRVGSSWLQEARLVSPVPPSTFEDFGSAVAVTTDRIFVGAPTHREPEFPASPARFGVVWVFRRTPTGLALEGRLDPPPTTSSGSFGRSLAVQGTTAIVGAPYQDMRGEAFVFEYDGTTWTQSTRLGDVHAPTAGYGFGTGVALDGQTAMIGSPADSPTTGGSRGAAYVFERAGAGWRFVTRLTSALPGDYSQLGNSLAVRGDLALVGAPGIHLTTAVRLPGRATLFARVAGTWREVSASFTGAAAEIDDRFGATVALTADEAIVGTPGDDAVPSGPGNWDFGSVRVFDLADLITVDLDGDGLSTQFEMHFGLDPRSATGADGAGGDPDGDGATNAQEQAAGTHPRGTVRRYLAEGATGPFFATTFAVLNAGATTAHALWRFQRDDGGIVTRPFRVPPRTRLTLEAATVAGIDAASFATLAEADTSLVIDRTMTWDGRRYGSHTETALAGPDTTWYLAEGATTGGFRLYYLLQNPQTTPTTATITYLRPAPAAPVVRTYTLPAEARVSIDVNVVPGLGATDVSAVVAATAPIVVERAMYLSQPGQLFAAGHASVGVTAPAAHWMLAEGATGSFFDLFVLIANPQAEGALVLVTYLLPDGTTLAKPYTIAPRSRFTIYVNDEQFPGSTLRPLANTPVATRVFATNGVPVIVERAMWWPHPVWHEAHNAAGATGAGPRWAVAGGEDGGSDGAQTYVLLANLSAFPGEARVTVILETGETVDRVYTLPANSRSNVPVGLDFPAAVNRRFGVLVESLGTAPAQLVVERATYWNSEGVVWAAGASALGTRLP